MTSRNNLVGQIQRPGRKPVNIDIVSDRRPQLTLEEASAGIQWVDSRYDDPGDIRRYGAVADGVTDDSGAFQRALNTGHPVTLPEGTVVINSVLSVSGTTIIRGQGKGKTIIDGTGISTTTDGVISIKGTLTQREDPSANISQFDSSITFSSAPTFSDNQVGLIWNPTNSSYSGFRTNYYAGEFFQVQDVAAQLDLMSQLYADYTAANVDIYSLDGTQAHVSDLTILAPDNVTAGLFVQHCVHSTIKSVDCRNSTAGALVLDKCFDVSVSDCSGIDRNDTDHGEDYALSISNCQNIRVSNCYFAARRHPITIGGDADTGAVVNRDIKVVNCVLTSFTDDGAADIHGNSEHVTYMGCTINGGISSWGGNFNKLLGCTVYGDAGTACFSMSEVTGLDHLIANNMFYSNGGNSSTRGWGLDVGGNDTSTITSDTGASGVLRFMGNTWVNDDSTSITNSFARIFNQGASVEMNLEFCGNSVQSADASSNILEVDHASGNEWNNVVICDNRLDNCAINVDSSTNPFVARNIIYTASTVAFTPGIEIDVTVNNGTAHVHGNIVNDAPGNGITVQEVGTLTGLTAYVTGNIDNNASGTYGMLVSGFDDVFLLNNISDGTIRAQTGTNCYCFGNSGPINTNISTFTEIGFDSAANIIMPSLPTSTPGGSDRVWNNSNVLNIT